ncbi:MAG: hypothetical protein ACI8W1_002493, partial [Candidatus Azotimanducaceae bacterium]
MTYISSVDSGIKQKIYVNLRGISMASRYSGLQTAFVAAALLLPTYSFAASSKR